MREVYQQPSKQLTHYCSRDSRPYIKVKILGLEMVGLLDSGATRCLMDEQTWERLTSLGLELGVANPGAISVANGDKMGVVGTICLPVELCGKIRIINFLVVPKLKYHLILGVDFWQKMSVIPNVERGTWSFDDAVMAVETGPAIIEHSALEEDQKQVLKEVVEKWKAIRPQKLGCTSAVKHVIETDHRPIKQRYYPVSPHIQGILNKELDEMLEQGIVVPSKSPWSSPVVLVKKPDGTHRFCVDYRQLNAVTKRDAYPLPFVSHILDRLRDGHYLSSIDIKSAYWQVALEEDSCEKTAFTIPGRGLFQFTRMPFGLHNSPATWQRLVDNVLGAELEPQVFVYLDDIVIITKDFKTHIQTLEEVFKRLAKANLTINWDKSCFCRPQLRYLGYVVNKEGLQVDPDKVSAIMDFPTPRTVKQIRRFLGLASWYRRFVPNFSTVVTPLTSLLKKGKKWHWDEDQKRAFEEVKNKLISAPILTCPDFSRPFVLQTDASTSGLGAILSQEYPEGEKAIAYASRGLTAAEKKFSTTEQECLAVLWAIEKFRPYLEGMKFCVVTDHMALKWLNSLKDPQGRLARWAVKLQQYDFTIQHRAGKLNKAADALSRVEEEQEEISAIDYSEDQLDNWYRDLCSKVRRQPEAYPAWKVEGTRLHKRVVDSNKILGEDRPWKLVVPKSQRKKLLFDFHDSPISGHLGSFKTLQRLKEQYYWPGMAADVARYVTRCPTCLSLKPCQQGPAGLMGGQRVAEQPWQIITTDLMGPLPLSTKQNRMLLVVCDYFTKYSILLPLRTATAKKIADLIEDQVFLKFGVPQVIICDNGVQFKGREFQSKMDEYGTKIWFTNLYHPQANPTERVNRVLKIMLSSYVQDNHRKWDSQLPKLEFALKTAVHEATGYTPAYLNYGRELPRTAADYDEQASDGTGEVNVNRESRLEKLKAMPLLYREVQDRLNRAYEKGCRAYNLRRRPVEYAEGQLVWCKTHPQSDASAYYSGKLAPRFVQRRIRRKISQAAYELENVETGAFAGIWSAKDLKVHPADD